jgi:UDP-N-acetylglucosamine--N-acetylmuramyl-(pentapeptide) pyrophosphoryl-undecaprenol N-acetylglucosamine transferase
MAGGEAATFAIVAGGGTAGHVMPGIAIAQALVARGHARSSIHFVGSSRGMEATAVPEAGFEVTLLPGRGIKRSFALSNFGALAGIVRAFFAALGLIRRHRPAVVIAMGGYASVPCALAAALWRIPIVVAEQNAVPGAANRLTARFAKAAAVAFEGTPLPRPVLTGNPVRPEVLAAGHERDHAVARAAMGVDGQRALLLVVGGSLGALRLNHAVLAALDQWRDRDDLAIHHIVGRRDWDAIRAATPELPGNGVQYRPVAYEEDMPGALAAADVVVARSGSSTCFEFAAVGVPAVLVPSPYVTGDHQTANARHLEEAGAAVVVPDAELDGERLVREVDALLAAPDRRDALSRAIRALARPQAADDIAALAEQHARPRR